MLLSTTHIIQLSSFSLLLSCGQILFKHSAMTVPPLTSINSLIILFLDMWFWLALILYGVATLLWIFLLQQIPLSLAYPFVALSFIVVPLASLILFKEPMNIFYVMGVFLIIAGLGVITIMASK